MVEHFGVRLARPEAELRLCRDNYICTTRDGRYYLENGRLRHSPEQWEPLRQAALENFDLTMAYCARLSEEGFARALAAVQERFLALEEVRDLGEWRDVPGVYLMALDRYRQAYVGSARSRGGIRQRILVHWQRKLAFNRLLSGGAEESILSIDSFRALDTTRIFAARVEGFEEAARLERAVFEALPGEFLCNRTLAGDLPGGLHEAMARRRTRKLA